MFPEKGTLVVALDVVIVVGVKVVVTVLVTAAVVLGVLVNADAVNDEMQNYFR